MLRKSVIQNIVRKVDIVGNHHFLLTLRFLYFSKLNPIYIWTTLKGRRQRLSVSQFSLFLAPLAEGQRDIVMALCPSVNFFFKKKNFSSETTDWIFTKFHMDVR